MRTRGAIHALTFQLAMRTRLARPATIFHLAMRTRCALRAIFFQPSMVASVAHRTTVFYLGMWTRGTLCAVTRDLAVRTSVAPRAVAFHPIVQASFHSQAYFHPGIHGLLTNKSASAVLNNASVMLSQNKSSAPCAGVDSPISLICIFFKYHGLALRVWSQLAE